MNPLKILLNSIKRSLSARSTVDTSQQDPLDHPDIRAMDLLQLADLPMPYRSTEMAADAGTQPDNLPLARCA